MDFSHYIVSNLWFEVKSQHNFLRISYPKLKKPKQIVVHLRFYRDASKQTTYIYSAQFFGLLALNLYCIFVNKPHTHALIYEL